MGFTTQKDSGGVLVVRVEGQLIVGNRQELKSVIQEAVDNGERTFLIDFSKTGYIDSSGLGALVSLVRQRTVSPLVAACYASVQLADRVVSRLRWDRAIAWSGDRTPRAASTVD